MAITSYQQFRDTFPRDRFCPLHGAVTRWHGCKVTEPGIFGKPIIAKSAWMLAAAKGGV